MPYLLIAFAVIGWIMANAQSKTQDIRLFDIFLYGPYLTYLAMQDTTYELNEAEKIFVLFLGTTTITYNARNYMKLA